jgi:hypothetical protein
MSSPNPTKVELDDFADLDRRRLGAVIADLAEAHPELVETINQTVNRIRSLTNARTREAVGEKMSLRESELFENMEKQYFLMIAALEGSGISMAGIPHWYEVEAGILELLDKIPDLAEPTLILVPPVSRMALIKAINKKYPVQGTENIHYRLENNDLWNNGRLEEEKEWRVCIAEGVENVKNLRLKKEGMIKDGKRPSHSAVVGFLLQKYRDHGLDVICDANTYLSLAMASMAAGKLIDTKRFTVLNGRIVSEDIMSEIAYGGCENGQMILDANGRTPISPYDVRLRGLVPVPVAQPPLQK